MSESNHSTNLNAIRHSGHLLGELLNVLYPPPANPDIITLEDVLTRYRLTGLGVPAITALQQAQRILRAAKDYGQIGLCEFHIGLIYLHWGHCLAAAQQFAEARRQWSFADETAAICLTYFAQGQAQYLALHYEAAMGCYHKTEQWLPRLKRTPLAAFLDGFVPQMTHLLKEAQETLREKMWPADEPERVAELGAAVPPTAAIVTEMATPPESHTDIETHQQIPAPIIFPGHRPSPTPALITTHEYYSWYWVGNRQGDFLPFIQEGEWILVDTRKQFRYEPTDLIIVGRRQGELNGSIPVHLNPNSMPIGLLTRIPTIAFERNVQTGRVLILDTGHGTVETDNILGVAVGFWLTTLQAGLDETQRRGF